MAFNVKKQALMTTARQLGINIRCMVKFGVESGDVSYAPDGRMLVCPRFRQKGLDFRCKDGDGRGGWVYPENLPPNGRKHVGLSVSTQEYRDR